MRLEGQSIRVKRAALMVMNTLKRRDYGYGVSNSSVYDSDLVTGNSYPIRNERFLDLTFFGRRKSLRQEEL